MQFPRRHVENSETADRRTGQPEDAALASRDAPHPGSANVDWKVSPMTEEQINAMVLTTDFHRLSGGPVHGVQGDRAGSAGRRVDDQTPAARTLPAGSSADERAARVGERVRDDDEYRRDADPGSIRSVAPLEVGVAGDRER